MNNPSGERRPSLASSPDVNLSVGKPVQDRWAIILAGGDGSRLLPLTRKIAGDDRPKQFCPIINGNTLLDETRNRVALGFSPERTMFVLTQKHSCHYNDALAGVSRANLIEQPRNAGTAPAILYSLLRLERTDPDAAAAFFPSDHYFSDNNAFMSEVDFAFDAVSRCRDSVVLLGIEPEGPDEEYGWIEPNREGSIDKGRNLWRVRRFWEKPSPALARELMARGCLWNSFVMVGRVSAFLQMIRNAANDLHAKFVAVKSELSTPNEKYAMDSVYRHLRDSNFSREVLQARPKDLAVIPVRGSKWSDLGSPRRVFSALSDLSSASLIKRKPVELMKTSGGYYERSRVRSSEVV